MVIESDKRNYYEILGVSKKASLDDLKKAYRAAIANHPDKGGDPEKIKVIAQAYGVLSVPGKREVYDRQIQDLVIPRPISLEDLYNGACKQHYFLHSVLCPKCKGKGSKSGASVDCSSCVGTGNVFCFTRHRMTICNQCKGTGETISATITDEDRCERCKGEKAVQEKKIFEFHVEKGMQNGQEIRFPREVINTVTGGGAVFILQQEEHPIFKRKGDDLFVEHNLSLMQALSGGFQFVLTHLDNRKLIIKSLPWKIVKPGQVKAINGEGMPIFQRPSMRGNLYIRFTVEFPDTIRLDDYRAVLSSPQLTDMAQLTDMEVVDEGVETTLRDVTIEDEMRWKQYDEDKDIPSVVGKGKWGRKVRWGAMSAAIGVDGNGGSSNGGGD